MRAVLIDLDGVIYDSKSIINNAAKTIDWLNTQSIAYLFVTNTSSIPRQAIVEKLAKFQINVDPQKILTPLVVARDWLRQHQPGAIALFLPPASVTEFNEFQIIEDTDESGADAVLIGDYGESWNYQSLNRAFRLLKSSEKPVLVALGMSRYWHSLDGLTLDVGPYIKALEFASECQTVVMGKPSRSFFDCAVAMLAINPDEIVMIGDDIKSDIGAAQQAGLKTILVRTGKFSKEDLSGDVEPDWVVDSIADLPELWSSL